MTTPSATAPAGQVHTATPWDYTECEISSGFASLFGKNGNIANMTAGYNSDDSEQAKIDAQLNANVSHIVHCVNTHSHLLAQNAALKAALENVLGFCATNQGMEAQMAMDDARAALGVSP